MTVSSSLRECFIYLYTNADGNSRRSHFEVAALEAPLALWIMKGFFDTVPIEIEEAAWVDGAARLRAAFRVVLPLAGPGVAAASLIGFIGAWNQFLVQLVLISDQENCYAGLVLPLSIRFRLSPRDDVGEAREPEPPLRACRSAFLPSFLFFSRVYPASGPFPRATHTNIRWTVMMRKRSNHG